MIKMEDWDLEDHEKFPQLSLDKYLAKIYYEETEVTQLEPMKWVLRVEKAGLLNVLWILHFIRMIINTACVQKLLMLVNDGCV